MRSSFESGSCPNVPTSFNYHAQENTKTPIKEVLGPIETTWPKTFVV